MKLSDRVQIPQEVIARQVGGETVMLDLAKGSYYGLDPVGARMWELMAMVGLKAKPVRTMSSIRSAASFL